MDDQVKVAVLEERLENFETLVNRLDSAIEKIAEVNNNVSRMLAVHEERISKQEEIDEVLFDKIDKLRDKMDLDHDNVTKRLALLERKLWIGIGALGAVLMLTNPQAIKMVKPLLTGANDAMIAPVVALLMDHVDAKYIGLLSTRLEKFKKVKPTLYNFRCPICGDSKKNKNKTRGYIYPVKANTNFKCHNCGASMSFNNFLKKVDPSLHKQYTMEKFKEGFTGKNFVAEEPQLKFEAPKFKKKLKLPKAIENPRASGYLMKQKTRPI